MAADEVARHLPGRHNQKTHGNRFKTPGDKSSGYRRIAEKLHGHDLAEHADGKHDHAIPAKKAAPAKKAPAKKAPAKKADPEVSAVKAAALEKAAADPVATVKAAALEKAAAPAAGAVPVADAKPGTYVTVTGVDMLGKKATAAGWLTKEPRRLRWAPDGKTKARDMVELRISEHSPDHHTKRGPEVVFAEANATAAVRELSPPVRDQHGDMRPAGWLDAAELLVKKTRGGFAVSGGQPYYLTEPMSKRDAEAWIRQAAETRRGWVEHARTMAESKAKGEAARKAREAAGQPHPFDVPDDAPREVKAAAMEAYTSKYRAIAQKQAAEKADQRRQAVQPIIDQVDALDPAAPDVESALKGVSRDDLVAIGQHYGVDVDELAGSHVKLAYGRKDLARRIGDKLEARHRADKVKAAAVEKAEKKTAPKPKKPDAQMAAAIASAAESDEEWRERLRRESAKRGDPDWKIKRDAETAALLASMTTDDQQRIRNAVADRGPGIFHSPLVGGGVGNVARYLAEGELGKQLADRHDWRTVEKAVYAAINEDRSVVERTPQQADVDAKARTARVNDLVDQAQKVVGTDKARAIGLLDKALELDPDAKMMEGSRAGYRLSEVRSAVAKALHKERQAAQEDDRGAELTARRVRNAREAGADPVAAVKAAAIQDAKDKAAPTPSTRSTPAVRRLPGDVDAALTRTYEELTGEPAAVRPGYAGDRTVDMFGNIMDDVRAGNISREMGAELVAGLADLHRDNASERNVTAALDKAAAALRGSPAKGKAPAAPATTANTPDAVMGDLVAALRELPGGRRKLGDTTPADSAARLAASLREGRAGSHDTAAMLDAMAGLSDRGTTNDVGPIITAAAARIRDMPDTPRRAPAAAGWTVKKNADDPRGKEFVAEDAGTGVGIRFTSKRRADEFAAEAKPDTADKILAAAAAIPTSALDIAAGEFAEVNGRRIFAGDKVQLAGDAGAWEVARVYPDGRRVAIVNPALRPGTPGQRRVVDVGQLAPAGSPAPAAADPVAAVKAAALAKAAAAVEVTTDGAETAFVPGARSTIGLAERPEVGRKPAMGTTQLGLFADLAGEAKREMDGQGALLDALLNPADLTAGFLDAGKGGKRR